MLQKLFYTTEGLVPVVTLVCSQHYWSSMIHRNKYARIALLLYHISYSSNLVMRKSSDLIASLLYRRKYKGIILVYLIVRGLKGISFDTLFICCDSSTSYSINFHYCHFIVRNYSFLRGV